MDKSTHQIHCEQWMQLINECLASGMSKKAWCIANGISDKTFYYWQRILRNEAYIEQKQLPAVAKPKTAPPVAFVELKQTAVYSIGMQRKICSMVSFRNQPLFGSVVLHLIVFASLGASSVVSLKK